MIKGYIAGSLFNEAEKAQRLHEEKVLNELTLGSVDWYSPISAPVNDKDKLPTAKDIFSGDTIAVIHSDIIFADLTNNDTGVAMELGVAYGLQYARSIMDKILEMQPPQIRQALEDLMDLDGIKFKAIYGVCSDIRVPTANQYSGIHVPYGSNQYVIGGLESMDSVIVSNFDGAVDQFKKRIDSIKEEELEDEQKAPL